MDEDSKKRDAFARQIIRAVIDDEDARIPIQQLQAAMTRLSGVDRVLGPNDVLALSIPYGDVFQVVVQDNGSVIVTTYSTAGGDLSQTVTHRAWCFKPWDLSTIGDEPESVSQRIATAPLLQIDQNSPPARRPMPQQLKRGGEIFDIVWQDPKNLGINTILSQTRSEQWTLENIWCYIVELYVTDLHLAIAFNMDVRETRDSVKTMQTRYLVYSRKDSVRQRIDQAVAMVDSGWNYYGGMSYDDARRIILIKMIRRDAFHEIIDRGIMILTDNGQSFHNGLVENQFDTAHIALDAVWTWRMTEGGIVLSRFPIPGN